MDKSSVLASLRDAKWLDRRRAVAYGVILLLLELAAAAFMALGQRGFVVAFDQTVVSDFSSFYGAGSLALSGAASAVYDHGMLQAAQLAFQGDPTVDYNLYFYPPILLLLLAPLSALPYAAAFSLWAVAQVAALWCSLRAVVGRGAAMAPYFAFPAAALSLGMGQNALLTAALFAAGTALLGRGRPFLAGLVLGCLVYKPQFGLLLPVAFLAGREWRAFFGAAASVAALAAAATAAFGADAWAAFFDAMATRGQDTYAGTDADTALSHALFVSPMGAAFMLGAGRAGAYAAQAVGMAAAAAAVAWAWRRGNAGGRFQVLAAAALIAAPVSVFYDLMTTVVCMAWTVVEARSGGWLPWEKASVALVFAAVVFARSAGGAHLPVGLVACALMLAFGLRRAGGARHG
jgi:hypothetical protein